MKRVLGSLFLVVGLSGCAELGLPPHAGAPQSQVVQPAPAGDQVSSPVPSTAARTPEDFDTTTETQRAAAAAASASEGEISLGQTIASLGDPSDPGFWVSTSLVDVAQDGLVVAENGNSVKVELRPRETGGGEASLATLRLLEVPLTGLVPLDVFALR